MCLGGLQSVPGAWQCGTGRLLPSGRQADLSGGAAPDTASHSPVPPAFMEGLPDGSDSTIRAHGRAQAIFPSLLITLHARAESQWLWQPHQHNNNNSIVMNDCVF